MNNNKYRQFVKSTLEKSKLYETDSIKSIMSGRMLPSASKQRILRNKHQLDPNIWIDLPWLNSNSSTTEKQLQKAL